MASVRAQVRFSRSADKHLWSSDDSRCRRLVESEAFILLFSFKAPTRVGAFLVKVESLRAPFQLVCRWAHCQMLHMRAGRRDYLCDNAVDAKLLVTSFTCESNQQISLLSSLCAQVNSYHPFVCDSIHAQSGALFETERAPLSLCNCFSYTVPLPVFHCFTIQCLEQCSFSERGLYNKGAGSQHSPLRGTISSHLKSRSYIKLEIFTPPALFHGRFDL